ncbi:MAG: triose-phosphate isomerase [Candidatus Taylorbacteria bacterium]|nr:triose-phosphate isomerase [Candidatus Taylorbacteria bacterium]
MAKAKKSFLIVGNWKMNPETAEEARSVFSAVARLAAKHKGQSVVVAPPAAFIASLSKKGSPLSVAVQDVSHEASGAFTGSVSAKQAKSAGASYAIIGHSERRAVGDTDELVAKKASRALEAGLRIVLCVGETERDEHAQYLRNVRGQVLSVLSAIDKKEAKDIAIAYEPVWAIGKSYDTAPSPLDIHEMVIYIRKVAAEALGKKLGLAIPVLYGGSVDSKNAKDFLSNAGIDGLLVGRQSLDPKAFGSIIEYAASI